MKPLLTILLLHFFFMLIAQPKDDGKNFYEQLLAKQAAAIGKPFPQFETYDGKVLVNNETFKGKTVFINLWFEACSPCIAEMEGLNKLYNKIKDSQQVAFVAFTFEKPERIGKLKKKYDLQYPVVFISGKDCFRFNQGCGFPTNIILNSDGKISYVKSGGPTDKEKATEYLMTECYPKILGLLQKQ